MKKTLCKALNKHDNTYFIALEDIGRVSEPYRNWQELGKYIVRIEVNYVREEWYIDCNSKQEAEDLRNSIIKELEEYYGIKNN